MWREYNPNPCGRRVEDCAIRAVSKALDWDWEKTYATVCAYGLGMCDLPHSNSVWGAVLRENHFVRKNLPDTCPDCYTADEFSKDHPTGTYVLGFHRHTACMKDGIIYDAFDPSNETVLYYWVKEED